MLSMDELYFDTLTPLYASFHQDDHTFSLMWTEYRARFLESLNDDLAHPERRLE